MGYLTTDWEKKLGEHRQTGKHMLSLEQQDSILVGDGGNTLRFES